ncbi:MAG: hypothetical protein ACR2MC_00140 [Actinomycetota bacterium]
MDRFQGSGQEGNPNRQAAGIIAFDFLTVVRVLRRFYVLVSS